MPGFITAKLYQEADDEEEDEDEDPFFLTSDWLHVLYRSDDNDDDDQDGPGAPGIAGMAQPIMVH